MLCISAHCFKNSNAENPKKMFNAHLHVIFDDVVLNPLKPVLEVADGDNKIKPINPNKGGDRHGNFSHEF